MSLRKRFYLALLSSMFVIGVHVVANNLYLYWTYRQVDIVVHILGGCMSGLYVYVFLRYFKLPETIRNVFIGVFLIGIGWELLEIYYKVGEFDTYYWLDTTKDLIDDLIGAYLSTKIWKRLPEIK